MADVPSPSNPDANAHVRHEGGTPAHAPAQVPAPPRPPAKSVMRSLGEFIGHIAQGVKTPAVSAAPRPDPTDTARRVVRETVEEEERQTPQGQVVLRRTIIEEVELPPEAHRAAPAQPPHPPHPDQP